MKRIAIVDLRTNFAHDIANRIMLNEINEITLVGSTTHENGLREIINKKNPDTIYVCANAIDAVADWDFGIPVIGYALDREGAATIAEAGLPSIGVIKNQTHFINLAKEPNPVSEKKSEKKQTPEAVPAEPDRNDRRGSDEETKEPARQHKETEIDDDYAAFLAWKKSQEAKHTAAPVEDTKQKQTGREADRKESARDDYHYEKAQKTVIEEDDDLKTDNELKRGAYERNRSENRRRAEREFEEDISSVRPPAKIISVYAAKGGVGKTTIATELATYLALTAHGRGRYNVCIVDFNIDFGDVRSTLGLDSDSKCMFEWTLNIAERIERGEDPDRIDYSKKEIYSYLQKVDKSGLYALCAPVKHEESADIEQEELSVILRNLSESGEFDFIICDTGNNTRDSSIEAYRRADYVLLIATQDATTGICNASLCEALDAYGLSLDKIRVVINNAMPARNTGVDVQEVINYFPYECIAVIRHDTDIIKANNLSEPIVYNASHPVTKELQKIVGFVTGRKEDVPEPKKKGFFGRLFSK